jgi:hypothetical protein
MYPAYAEDDRRDRRSSQRSTVMLNYEYARLVEQDRRRAIAERIRIERALHPDDPGSPDRRVPSGRPGAGISPVRSVSTPAR